MLNKNMITKISTGFLVLVLLVVPQLSYADWSIGVGIGDHHDDRDRHADRDRRDDHHSYRWHDHPHYGVHMHFIPAGYLTIRVGGARYYYYDGLYYSYVGQGDYVIVNPPVGAYVNVIPSDFQAVNINGRTYYADNGVYYILTRHHGYKVVAAPLVYAQPAPINQSAYSQGTFPINIPNNNGSYVTIVLRRSGNGYLGPQGEFYAQFPSVAQLKVMYGK